MSQNLRLRRLYSPAPVLRSPPRNLSLPSGTRDVRACGRDRGPRDSGPLAGETSEGCRLVESPPPRGIRSLPPVSEGRSSFEVTPPAVPKDREPIEIL